MIDVLVNNAGIGGGEPIEGSDIGRWRRRIETNLTGMYLVTRALALEMTARHITENALCPGWVSTEMAAHGMRQSADATGQTYNICGGQTMD